MEDNIEMYLKYVRCGYVDYIQLSQHTACCSEQDKEHSGSVKRVGGEHLGSIRAEEGR
jgi:predicted metal-dependent phosphotriesterase family hydrolase